MASGENVLWLVIKRLNYGEKDHVADKIFVFRTRKAAIEFWNAKNKKTKKFHYLYPERATWGPEQ